MTRPYIVTGGNKGIGKAIAHTLAEQGQDVVIVSRSKERGQRAIDEIKRAHPRAQIEIVQGDLGSIAQAMELAKTLNARYPSMAGLINNAGIWMTSCEHNEDGFERSFMVNHLGTMILSRMLYPTLQRNAPARIVNVNAGLYIKGKYAPEQTPQGTDFHRIRTYANTKLWSVLFTIEMARRIAGSGVTINAIHPGVIRTDLGDTGGLMGWLLRGIKRLWKSPQEGADGPVWLATAPEHAETNGIYYDQRKVMPFSKDVLVPGRAGQCWALSEKLVPGLPPLEVG